MNMKRFVCLIAILFTMYQAQGQCNWPDSVSSKYRETAWRMVYEKAYASGEYAVTHSLFLPEDSMKLALGLIGCVYNDTGATRDSIFKGAQFEFIHFKKYHSELYRIPFIAPKGTAYADSWLYGKSSGNQDLEDILINDSFSRSCSFRYFYQGNIFHKKAINTAFLADTLNKASGSNHFMPYSSFNSDGNQIRWRRHKDTQWLTFTFRWGDCMAGCEYYKSITYAFYGGKKYGPTYEDNVPDLGKGPHLLTSASGQKNQWNCGTADYNYSPSILWPYSYYTGTGWGRWFVNGKDQSAYMEQNHYLFLEGNGTFYIAHVPKDSNGVWYNDTFTVNIYRIPSHSIFEGTDTALLCAHYWSGQTTTLDEILPIFSPWLRDSIANKTWNISFFNVNRMTADPVTFYPSNVVQSAWTFATSSNYGCKLNDTLYYKARFFPSYLSRSVEQPCLHTPLVQVKPNYPARGISCSGNWGDSFCLFPAPSTQSLFYTYEGCKVLEEVYVVKSTMNPIETHDSFALMGYDTLRIDAGEGWKSVEWNHQLGNRYFTFTGNNQSRIDTLHLKCIDSNDCYDTLLIRIHQEAIAGVGKPISRQTKIYPNPAQEVLFIQTAMQESWEIRNLQGQLMISGLGTQSLNTSLWSPGIYIFVAAGEKAQRFVVTP